MTEMNYETFLEQIIQDAIQSFDQINPDDEFIQNEGDEAAEGLPTGLQLQSQLALIPKLNILDCYRIIQFIIPHYEQLIDIILSYIQDLTILHDIITNKQYDKYQNANKLIEITNLIEQTDFVITWSVIDCLNYTYKRFRSLKNKHTLQYNTHKNEIKAIDNTIKHELNLRYDSAKKDIYTSLEHITLVYYDVYGMYYEDVLANGDDGSLTAADDDAYKGTIIFIHVYIII